MAVGGVMLDECVLLENSIGLLPAAHTLLRQLRHSNILTGISYGPGLEPHKVRLLKEIAMQYSLHSFLLDASSIDNSINEVALAWREIGGRVLYLASDNRKDIFPPLSKSGWLVVVMKVEGSSACGSSSMIYINKLQELPLTICHLNKKAIGNSVVTVAYIMKPSREEDFAKRGAFPMCPTQNGLMFMPLTFELPLSPQLLNVDVLLHKATDEIMSVDLKSLHSSKKITYSRGMQELQGYMEHHQDLCVIDPLNSINPVLDRLEIQQILLALEDLKTGKCCAIRGAHYLKAIVFRVEDFKDLTVPLPAIIQEYVDHSSTLYKFYILGEKVYHAVKSSTPNADTLIRLSGSKPLVFDSLKSLPTSKLNPNSVDNNSSKDTKQCIDLELVTSAANFLMRKLDLTVFGFDVVIQEGSGDHVIVDVNYLPSFKEVPNVVAIPAFWDAIKRKFELKRKNQV
ncbi:inositol 1,3,4-trisphosphate 5/6-kinase 4 isoform X2 [Argentina anserina]|uniref:inositol 1,3,4-trisphosphate 5/6-kinase 4 isoform X2 n=1 Tax=Argentina anserina TaxID=57926 RepID=UPI0021762E2C|nr:inositol 1,3,4-trisphosphate 5/6-kinase 4 isoform X2 [Potentilla anserina]